ncbi:MAG: carboxypeptidase M32, partial [Gaiellaceae bacterium]
MDADLRALKERLAEISDLARAGMVLAWDQKVTMPYGGHPARADQLATLSKVVHERFVD